MDRTLFIESIAANSNLIHSGEIREACLLCVHRRHLAEGASRVWSQMAVASFSLEPSIAWRRVVWTASRPVHTALA